MIFVPINQKNYYIELSSRGETATEQTTTLSSNGRESARTNHDGLALGIGVTAGLLLFLLAAISGGFI